MDCMEWCAAMRDYIVLASHTHTKPIEYVIQRRLTYNLMLRKIMLKCNNTQPIVLIA